MKLLGWQAGGRAYERSASRLWNTRMARRWSAQFFTYVKLMKIGNEQTKLSTSLRQVLQLTRFERVLQSTKLHDAAAFFNVMTAM